MKISVITPTVRPEGLELVAKGLSNQTFKDFEWLICSPGPKAPILTGLPYTYIHDDFKGGFWSLNRAYNELFKVSQGELIVSLQDWIYIDPDGLQKFWDAHEAYPEAIISGVGDQYEQLDQFGKPEVKIWADPRKRLDQGSFYEINPEDCEWNYAAFPRSAIIEVGGMDEQLDFLGYGGDQYQVGERWDGMGKKFFIDQDNESFTLRHDRSAHGGQEKWDQNHVLFNGKYTQRKQELIKSGQWPKLNYLR